MPVTRPARLFVALTVVALACDPGVADQPADEPPIDLCGPSRGVVASVIDGDTVVLTGGEKVRYLMIDTPEITNGKRDCFGADARAYNEELVLGQEIALTYDAECTDRYGRLLAHVEAPDGEVNKLMVERGYACVLVVPPNGVDLEFDFMALEREARDAREGMWGACGDVTCDD